MGNKNPAFLEQRRDQLEKYLQELLIFFRIQLPRVLAEFLDFNKYDIIYLLQDLAKLFNESGSALLSSKKEFNFSALEVFAISERLCLPCPPENIEQRGKFDFSHVLDFCTQLEVLIVTPVKDNTSFSNDYNTVDVPIDRSNIIPKNLRFTLNAFRNVKTLKFHGLSTENIVDIALLKPTMQTIFVHSTTLTHINQILLCDNIHRDILVAAAASTATISTPDNISYTSTSSAAAQSTSNSSRANTPPPCLSDILPFIKCNWSNLAYLDLTGNLLTQIDASVRTAPQLQTLVLDQNRIRSIQNLAELSQLQTLSLSVNLIAECIDWHLELGNLVTLNLAQNRLKKLRGLRKLLSLVNLDLSCNLVEDLEEVDNVTRLPILETLRLTGNPLAGSVDYRARVLSRFHERAPEISLDNERGTQKELDTALVLSALHTSKLRQMNGQR
ncbi:nischarin isoform X2 [Eurosta solidaginis]